MRSLLDHQADGIEYTLHSHGIDGSVAGGNISPRLIQFHIKLGAGVRYNRVVALADELALALGVTHCRITREGHYVKIEVPRPDPVAVRLFPLMRNLPGDLPPNSPILGLDENGVPLLLRLDSPDIGHILISGTSGSGKTILTRTMIASLALQNDPDHLKMLLIDPRGKAYREFSGLPNSVCDIVTDPADGVHRLRWALRHMEKRDENGINHPLLVIFIDELVDLMMLGGKELEYIIMRLTQRGRDCGIHLVVSTQKPSASAVGAIARSNFSTRLVGRMVSLEDARLGSGQPGSGADKLMGRGDFLLFSQGETSRVQVAHIGQEEMLQTVDYLQERIPAQAEPRRRAVAESRQQYEPRRLQPARPQADYGYQEEQRFTARQEFQRQNQHESEEDYYQPETSQNYASEESYQPRRAARSFQAAPSNTYTDLPPEKKGIAERLAEYRNSLEQRHYAEPPEPEYEDEVAEELPQITPRPIRPIEREQPAARPPERLLREREQVSERVQREEPIVRPAERVERIAREPEREQFVPKPIERKLEQRSAPVTAKPALPPLIDFDEEDIPLPPPPPAKPVARKMEAVAPARPVEREREQRPAPVVAKPAPAPEMPKPAQRPPLRNQVQEENLEAAAKKRPTVPPLPATNPAQRPPTAAPASGNGLPRPGLGINPLRPTGSLLNSSKPLSNRSAVPPVPPKPRPVQPVPRPEISSRQNEAQRDLWDDEPDFVPDPEPEYSGDFDYDEAYDKPAESRSTLNERLSSLPGNLKLMNGRSLLDGMQARKTSDNYKVSS